jgi:hypothetical protein
MVRGNSRRTDEAVKREKKKGGNKEKKGNLKKRETRKRV